jgi:hypothetical protein
MHVVAPALVAFLTAMPNGALPANAGGSASLSVADRLSPSPIETPFDADGYSALGRITPGGCLVGSDVDLSVMVDKTSTLQSKGLIRPDVDKAHVQAHAWTTASAIALQLEPILITAVFRDHPDIKTCGFVQTITGFDGKVEAAYGFAITRALYDKVDWATFSPQDLPDVSENFQIGPVTAAHMNAEAKLRD